MCAWVQVLRLAPSMRHARHFCFICWRNSLSTAPSKQRAVGAAEAGVADNWLFERSLAQSGAEGSRPVPLQHLFQQFRAKLDTLLEASWRCAA